MTGYIYIAIYGEFMRMSLQEIMDTCSDWELFCEQTGFSVYAVNEGGGDITVELTTQEAHKFGIVKLPDWKIK